MMRIILIALALILGASSAHAQGYQCRTAKIGGSNPIPSTSYCASEAMVSNHFPSSSTAGHLAAFADSSGQVLEDGGSIPSGTVQSVGSGVGLTGGPITTTGTLSIDPSYLRDYLAGLTLSNDGTSPNTVLDISAGIATDSTNAALIKIGAFTKSTAGAWASGTGQNGMGNGLTIANSTWYHVCLANNSGTPDIWFDTSASCANRPSGISDAKYRRIGSFKTNGSAQIIAFSQNGDEFLLATPVQDLAISNSLTSSASLQTLASVPTGVKVNAIGIANFQCSTANFAVLLSSPDTTDTAPALNGIGFTGLQNSVTAPTINMRTNTSAQIRGRGTTTINFGFTTQGWIDTRGKTA